MTDPQYRPKNAHDALVRIAEECSEIQYIVCKGLRFGIYDYHPKTKVMNMDALLAEVSDLKEAVNDFLRLNNDIKYPAI